MRRTLMLPASDTALYSTVAPGMGTGSGLQTVTGMRNTGPFSTRPFSNASTSV